MPRPNPNYPSSFLVIYSVVVGTTLFAFGIWFDRDIVTYLKTGQIYSFGVLINAAALVHRNTSPVEYWAVTGAAMLGGLFATIMGPLMPIIAIRGYIQKRARLKKERMATTHSK